MEPVAKIVIRETNGLEENVHTRYVDQSIPIVESLHGPRGLAIDDTNRAKLMELLRELVRLVARECSIVQTITIDFHVAA